MEEKLPDKAAVLVFNLDTHKDDFIRTSKADDMYMAFQDIHEEVWRPSWKHGYRDSEVACVIEKINAVLEKEKLLDDKGEPIWAETLISELNKIYRRIIKERGLEELDL